MSNYAALLENYFPKKKLNHYEQKIVDLTQELLKYKEDNEMLLNKVKILDHSQMDVGKQLDMMGEQIKDLLNERKKPPANEEQSEKIRDLTRENMKLKFELEELKGS